MAFDILLAAVVLIGGFMGFSKGLLGQLGSIIAIVGGIIAARALGDTITAWIAGEDGPGAFDAVAGYGLAFLAAYALIWLVARVARGAVRAVHLGIIDSMGGAIFKVGQWLLLLSLALNFFMLLSPDTQIEKTDKPWRKAAVDFAPAVLGYLADITNIQHSADVIHQHTNTDS